MDRNKLNAGQVNIWVDERMSALGFDENWRPDLDAGFARLTKSLPTPSWTRRRGLQLAAAVATVICLSILAYPSPKVFARRCITECSVVWQSISPLTAVPTSLKFENARKIAPDFVLKDENDRDVKLSGLRGKVVLVNFWATWCHGCQLEIPWYVEFQKKYGKQGLVVVGISMDEDGWKSVRPWMSERRINYPIVIGNQSVADRFGLSGMPLSALVDRDGNIADAHVGVVDKDATEQKIRALLQEKANR